LGSSDGGKIEIPNMLPARQNILTDEEVSFLQQEFTLADTNTDGKISPAELMIVSERMGFPFASLEEAEKVCRGINTHLTGSIPKKERLEINFGQLLTLFKKQRALGGVSLKPRAPTTPLNAPTSKVTGLRGLESAGSARRIAAVQKTDSLAVLKAVSQLENALDNFLDSLASGFNQEQLVKILALFQFALQSIAKGLQTGTGDKSEQENQVEALFATLQVTKGFIQSTEPISPLTIQLGITEFYNQTRELVASILETQTAAVLRTLGGTPHKYLVVALCEGFVPVTKRLSSESAQFRTKVINSGLLDHISQTEDGQEEGEGSPEPNRTIDQEVKAKKDQLKALQAELLTERKKLELEKTKLLNFHPERESASVLTVSEELCEKQNELLLIREAIAKHEQIRQKMVSEHQEELNEYTKNIATKKEALQNLSDAMAEMVKHAESDLSSGAPATPGPTIVEFLSPRLTSPRGDGVPRSGSRLIQPKDWSEVLEEKKRLENFARMEKEIALKLEIISAKEQEIEAQHKKSANNLSAVKTQQEAIEEMTRKLKEDRQLIKDKEARCQHQQNLLDDLQKDLDERNKEFEIQYEKFKEKQKQLESKIEELEKNARDAQQEAAEQKKIALEASAKAQQTSSEVVSTQQTIAQQMEELRVKTEGLQQKEAELEHKQEEQIKQLQAMKDQLETKSKTLLLQEEDTKLRLKQMAEKEKEFQDDLQNLEERVHKAQEAEKRALAYADEQNKIYEQLQKQREEDNTRLSSKIKAKREEVKKMRAALDENVEKEEKALEQKKKELDEQREEVAKQQQEYQKLISFEQAKLSDELAEKLESLNKLNQEMAAKEKIIAELNINSKRVEKQEQEIAELRKEMNKDAKALTEKLSEAKQKEQSWKDKREALENEFRVKFDELKLREETFANTLEDIQKEKASLQTAMKNLADKKKKAANEEATNREKVALELKNLESTQEQIKAETEEFALKQKELNDREREIQKLEAKYSTRDADIKKQQHEVDAMKLDFEASQEKMNATIDQFRKEKEIQNQELSKKMAELNKNKSLLKKAKREVKDSKQKNQKNEANIKLERDALNRERQQFEAWKAEREAQIEHGEETLNQIEAENKQLKSMILEEKNKNFSLYMSQQGILEKEKEEFQKEKILVQEKYNHVVEIESTLLAREAEILEGKKKLQEMQVQNKENKAKWKKKIASQNETIVQKTKELATSEAQLRIKETQVQETQKDLNARLQHIEAERERLTARFTELQTTMSQLLSTDSQSVKQKMQDEEDQFAKVEILSQALFEKQKEVEQKYKEALHLQDSLKREANQEKEAVQKMRNSLVEKERGFEHELETLMAKKTKTPRKQI